ncbi:MAG: hypothetical protein R3C04_12060 [Hyphomonas sp.]
MKVHRLLLAGAWLAFFMAGPARAEPEADGQAYQRLDIWMRADALNQRCNVVNYFETRQVTEHLGNAARATPEGAADLEALGHPTWPAANAVYKAMLAERRAAATAAVAGAECSANHPDIVAVRKAYTRPMLKQLMGGYESASRKTDTAGRRAASDNLIKFIISLYGNDTAQTLMKTLNGELVAEGAIADSQWAYLKTEVDDALWQTRLSEKGYKFVPVPGRDERFRAAKSDGSGAFPATFRPRREFTYKDTLEGLVDIRISIAEGWTDDGRLVILLSKDAADWGAPQLKAELLAQQDPGPTEWNRIDWRGRATAYAADPPGALDCPADFCFIFPQEVTEAIRTRHMAVGEVYSYELYIAPDALFPFEKSRSSAFRTRYYPPALPDRE